MNETMSVNLATKSEDACYSVCVMQCTIYTRVCSSNICARFCFVTLFADVCHCIFVQIANNLHFYVRPYAIRIISSAFSESSIHAIQKTENAILLYLPTIVSIPGRC